MQRSLTVPAGSFKAPRQHTTVTLRKPIIPKVDAIVEIYRKHSGQTLTRTDVVNALLMDAYNEFVATGLITDNPTKAPT